MEKHQFKLIDKARRHVVPSPDPIRARRRRDGPLVLVGEVSDDGEVSFTARVLTRFAGVSTSDFAVYARLAAVWQESANGLKPAPRSALTDADERWTERQLERHLDALLTAGLIVETADATGAIFLLPSRDRPDLIVLDEIEASSKERR